MANKAIRSTPTLRHFVPAASVTSSGYRICTSFRRPLQSTAFEHISDDLARSDVPFITEKDYESVPDDDPRWEDDLFEPPDRPATFYRCIFGI